MTPKERRFVSEYLKSKNATQSAIQAGYSKRSAGELGHRLLKKVEIKAAIEANLKKAEADAVISVSFILQGLKEVAQRCMQAHPVMEFDHELKEMVRTGEWEFDSAGANRALELLGKHLKMFTDNVHHTGLTLEQLVAGSGLEKKK